MVESNIRKCKICNLEKSRTLVGKYPDGRNNKWVDENGRDWNGRICGDCNVIRVKGVMKRIRK